MMCFVGVRCINMTWQKPFARGILHTNRRTSNLCYYGYHPFYNLLTLTLAGLCYSVSFSKRMASTGETRSLPTLVQQQESKPWYPVLAFWFPEADAEGAPAFQPWWFKSSDDLDKTLREKFQNLLEHYEQDKSTLNQWETTTLGSLAKILVFDQFPRNIYRGSAKAFAFDKEAQRICVKGLAEGLWETLPESMRLFALLPLMHAEDMELQNRSLEEFNKLPMFQEGSGTRGILLDHYNLVKKFGRFPYRNKLLGRTSTEEEEEYLKNAENTYGVPK